jgi:hypothetical protein
MGETPIPCQLDQFRIEQYYKITNYVVSPERLLYKFLMALKRQTPAKGFKPSEVFLNLSLPL